MTCCQVPEFRRNEILILYQVFESAATDLGQRRREFVNVLRIHYKWAGSQELRAMFDVVYHHEVRFQQNLLAQNLVNENTPLILELFGSLDKDRNGVIDLNEFEKVLPSSRFADADANADGVLSVAEFTTFLTANSHLIERMERYLRAKGLEKSESRRKKLEDLFESYPQSPGSGWRPSLSMLRKR